MHVVVCQWKPTIWQCAVWVRPVWGQLTGWPYWASGNGIGRARNPPMPLGPSFLSMAGPALSPWPGDFHFSLLISRVALYMGRPPGPIRIGYCLSLTGPVAGNSRSAKLAHDIWREEVNSRGGLLERPVELICYDDHADASLVPDIYKRLMDEDKVDLVIGGYGTNTVLPARRPCTERER